MAQRQFRSDDTSPWIFAFGDGSDGAYSSVGSATDAPIDSSCSGTSGATSLSATNASFAAGKPILIHQSRGTGVGAWELNYISGYTAGTITTRFALTNTYTDSGASQAQVIQLKQYSSFTQNSGHTLTAKAWDGNVGGIIAFLCNGEVTVTGSIVTSGKGYRGGSGGSDSAAWCGEGTGAVSTVDVADPAGNGGGSQHVYSAGGGHASTMSGGEGTSGTAAGNAGLTTMVFGGGGGGTGENSSSGAGGSGAGIVIIIAKKIVVTGSIVNSGANGQNATRGGSGGAGGSVLLKGQTITLGTNLVTAAAGAQGSGTTSNSTNGSVGRIHLDYLTSYTGTTTPTIDVTQDLSLKNYAYLSAFML